MPTSTEPDRMDYNEYRIFNHCYSMKKTVKQSALGNTTINHNVRVALCISNDMYVFLDAIEKIIQNGSPVDYEAIERRVGIPRKETINLFNLAIEEGYIEYTQSVTKVRLDKKWKEAFRPEDSEFDAFWLPMDFLVEGEKKRVSWTGSKYDARTKFLKVRKEESFEYLMEQKEKYFRVIAHSDWRRIMGCSVFLNKETKRYAEDWDSLLPEGAKRESIGRKLDRKDVSKLFNS